MDIIIIMAVTTIIIAIVIKERKTSITNAVFTADTDGYIVDKSRQTPAPTQEDLKAKNTVKSTTKTVVAAEATVALLQIDLVVKQPDATADQVHATNATR